MFGLANMDPRSHVDDTIIRRGSSVAHVVLLQDRAHAVEWN